jgi:hypothetical protein
VVVVDPRRCFVSVGGFLGQISDISGTAVVKNASEPGKLEVTFDEVPFPGESASRGVLRACVVLGFVRLCGGGVGGGEGHCLWGGGVTHANIIYACVRHLAGSYWVIKLGPVEKGQYQYSVVTDDR